MQLLDRVRLCFGLSARSATKQKEAAQALINRGNQLEDLFEFQKAMDCYESAKSLAPLLPRAHLNVGNIHLHKGEFKLAQASYAQALQLNPDYAEAHFNLGNAHLRLTDKEAAHSAYTTALQLKPNFLEARLALDALADVLIEGDDAEATYRRALDKTVVQAPTNSAAKWARTMACLHPIFDTHDELLASRHEFIAALADLTLHCASLPPGMGGSVVGSTQPFNLAYQPLNNLSLLIPYGDLCARLMQPTHLPPATPHQDKLRIGIASAHIRDHSVWNAFTRGFIEQVDRSRFEVFLFHLAPRADSQTDWARNHADHFFEGLQPPSEWTADIVDANLDALLYPEIGMDSLTTQLAAQRLAPLQAVWWGHPHTTGLPTIDWFISGDLMEPALGADHYREKLVRLPNLGVYVSPLTPIIEDVDLAALRLPANEPLLLCAGMPFKYLPKDDWIWVELGKRLIEFGAGRLVFFDSHYKAMSQQLERRLRHAFAKANINPEHCVCFIEQLPRTKFYGLMHRSTALLDTIEFSGFNTAIQSIECALPVVAFEGEFMRGRLASALLRRIKLDEWISDNGADYIESAMRLVTCPATLLDLKEHIVKHRNDLFYDKTPVRELEQLLLRSTKTSSAQV